MLSPISALGSTLMILRSRLFLNKSPGYLHAWVGGLTGLVAHMLNTRYGARVLV